MRVLLENTTFLLHKIVGIEGIIRVAGIIQGRALCEEIRYDTWTLRHMNIFAHGHFCTRTFWHLAQQYG